MAEPRADHIAGEAAGYVQCAGEQPVAPADSLVAAAGTPYRPDAEVANSPRPFQIALPASRDPSLLSPSAQECKGSRSMKPARNIMSIFARS